MADQPSPADSIEALLGDDVPTLDAPTGSGQYYLPPSHLQLLEQLEHLSRYSHFIQVICGVAGIGKTTLLQQFYPGTSDSAVHACRIDADPNTSAEALLNQLAIELNLNVAEGASASAQFDALLEHTQLLKQLSRQLLIVIDDADQLAPDALELLLNQLSTLPDEEARPHLVLFAAPEIRQQLAQPNLAEVVESSCHFTDIAPPRTGGSRCAAPTQLSSGCGTLKRRTTAAGTRRLARPARPDTPCLTGHRQWPAIRAEYP